MPAHPATLLIQKPPCPHHCPTLRPRGASGSYLRLHPQPYRYPPKLQAVPEHLPSLRTAAGIPYLVDDAVGSCSTRMHAYTQMMRMPMRLVPAQQAF